MPKRRPTDDHVRGPGISHVSLIRQAKQSLLFEFLNAAEEKMMPPSILKLPYKLIDGTDTDKKPIFPTKIK